MDSYLIGLSGRVLRNNGLRQREGNCRLAIRDREEIRTLKSATERSMRAAVSDSMRLKPTVHGVLFQHLLDHVGFRSREDESVLEQLLPTQYHIASHLVETYRKEDFERMASGSMEYSTLEQPIYRTCVERAPQIGYSKLRCVDKFEDLVTADASRRSSQAGGAITPSKPPASPLPPHKKETAPPQPALKRVDTPPTGNAKNKGNLLFDRYPTPVEEKRHMAGAGAQSRYYIDPLTEESETESESSSLGAPMTGGELLREIEDRLRATTPVPGRRRPPPPPRADNRLQPQHDRSDPVWARQVSQEEEQREKGDGPAAKQANAAGAAAEKGQQENAYYVATRSRKLKDAVANGTTLKPHKLNGLNAKCFVQVSASIDDDEDAEEKAVDPYPRNLGDDDDDGVERRVYLGSRAFMQHFAGQFYELARQLGKGGLADGARILDPAVMCREERDSEGDELAKEASLDFIPSVEVGFWPDEAIEWYLKKRPKVRDKRTNAVYQWPSAEIVSQAQRIGCNLVPVGFVEPTRGKRLSAAEAREADTQWRIQFAALEGIVQQSLNSPKMRCYLFALLLWKTHLQGASQSILPVHIRHQFYWLVEKSPAQWTEENLGVNLIHLLRSLRDGLRRQRLPNYFLSRENLCSTLPAHRLASAHERCHRFQENPVPFLLTAVARLHCGRGFYPALDVDRLYDILTTTETLALINPQLMLASDPRGRPKLGGNVFERSKMENQLKRAARSADPGQERMRRDLQRRKEQLAQRRASQQSAASTASTATLLGGSGDGRRVDLSLSLGVLDPSRGRLVLEFFAEHLLALAASANDFRAHGQCRLLLRTVENLLRLAAELKLDGSGSGMQLRQELERIRQVSRASAEDYWNVNWAVTSSVSAGGGVGPAEERMNSSSTTASGKSSSFVKEQSEPLPKVPSFSDAAAETTIEVDVHKESKEWEEPIRLVVKPDAEEKSEVAMAGPKEKLPNFHGISVMGSNVL